MVEALVITGLIVYSNALNLWPPYNGPLFVPLNLTAAGLLVGVASAADDVGLDDIVGVVTLDGFVVGAALGAVVGGALLLAAITPLRHVVADARVRHLRGPRLAYQTLVRVPLGTALLEEIAFRGVLLALLSSEGTSTAALISSGAFALWHVSATLNAVRANRPNAGSRGAIAAVLGAMLFTGLAGLALSYLRFASDGLAAPFALHATVNGFGTVAAVVAHRRR